jgi:STE24 endopeptidase
VAAFWLAGPLTAWLRGFEFFSQRPGWQVAALYCLVLGLHMAVSFPLSWYRGYVMEHQFGLSRQSPRAWLWRYVKQGGLAGGLGMLFFLMIFWLIWNVGAMWWLAAAVAFFLVSILLGQLLPVVVVPLFYRVERLEAPELTDRLARLAERTGLNLQGVYRIDISAETVKANAMLAGLGRTRRVLLGDTLLDRFTHDEIEVIFAHEVGHHVHRHIPKLMAIGGLFGLVGFGLCDVALMAYSGPVPYGDVPVAALPLLMLVITLFSMLMEPLQNVISRHFERQCDRYALERTGMRDAYRAAFRKLARLNKDDPAPNPVTVFLFHSHPPIGERLAMADGAE